MFYAFPPFSIISQVIKKIELDGATGILIVLDWPTQAWYPLLRRLLLADPLRLNWQHDLVILPFRTGPHPLGKKLQLMACHLCGVVYVLEPVNECTKTVLFVTFIIRASLVDPPPPPSGYSRLGPAASITNVVMVTVVATYITFPHTYFVMDSISEINDFSIQLNENSPLKCLLIKCLWQLIKN